MDGYEDEGKKRSFSPSRGQWQGQGQERAWKGVNKEMQVHQIPHQNQPLLALCAMDLVQIKEALATTSWEDVMVIVHELAQKLNISKAIEEVSQRHLELMKKRDEEFMRNIEWQNRRNWELQQELEATVRNATTMKRKYLPRHLEVSENRHNELMQSLQLKNKRILELECELEKKEKNASLLHKLRADVETRKKQESELAKELDSRDILARDLQREMELKKEKEKRLMEDLLVHKKHACELQQELDLRTQREGKLVQDLEAKFKVRETKLLTSLESKKEEDLLEQLEFEKERGLKLQQLEEELVSIGKRERKQLQELDSKKNIEKKMQKNLDVGMKMNGDLLRNLSATSKDLDERKQKEEELLKDIDHLKKVEEELLLKVKNIQLDHQREQDLWLNEKRHLKNLYDQALKKIKQLQYDVTIEKEKLKNNTLKIQERIKCFVLAQKKFQKNYANKDLELSTFKLKFENMMKEKDQIEQQLQNRLIEQKASFECKDLEVVALQAQLVQTKEEKKQHLIEIEELIVRRKELVFDINSSNSLLNDHVSALMVNLKDFERILHNPDLADSPMLAICNNHNLECKISDQDVSHKKSDAHKIVEEKSNLEFPLIAINLLQKIKTLKSILSKVAIVWKKKHYELEMKLELKSKDKRKYLCEIFQELGHYGVPLLEMLDNHKKEEGLIKVQETRLSKDPSLQNFENKECHEPQLLTKDPVEKASIAKGFKTKVTTSTSKRKISIITIGDNKKPKKNEVSSLH